MKRKPLPTKRERKAQATSPARGSAPHDHDHQHIHCVACGRHLDEGEFDGGSPTATVLTCQHGSHFPACVACKDRGQGLLDEHDRTGQPVKAAGAWH